MINSAPITAARKSRETRVWAKGSWPLLLACGFLVFVCASSVHLVISSQSSREIMNQTLEVENKLWGIMAVVRVAESEQRGYLLTGDPAYLEVYQNTIEASAIAIADAVGAVAADPLKRRLLASIEQLIVRKFAELRETMRLHDAADHAAALALVRTGVGRALMTSIRAALFQMMDEQRREIAAQTSTRLSTNIWLLLINLVGITFIIVLALISALVTRSTAEKELAESVSRGDDLLATIERRRKADRKFKDMLEAAPAAMVVVNQCGEIILLNLQAEKQFGYRRDELLGQTVTNIIPEGFSKRLLADNLPFPADAFAHQRGTGTEFMATQKDGIELPVEPILSPLESGEEIMVTASISDASVRMTGRRKDGAEFPIEIMLSPLESGEGILVVRDISQHEDVEKHLALMEARYHGLLEAAPDAMVVVNHGGEIVLLNLQAEKEFGYLRDELLGQNIKKIIPERVAERLIASSVGSSIPLQIGTEIELTGRRKDGVEFPIEIMLSPLESAERILVIRDISVRRQTERLKDEFVATVSHELRTPLTSISGSLGLLAGQWASKLPESAVRLLTIAHTNSQRLARLLNDILDIEKLESGRVVFNLSKVEVYSLVQDAIEDNRGFAASYGVQVRLDCASVNADVNADPDRLAQVVTNLLSNAIKFSPSDGEVVVAVEQHGSDVRVVVRDHGPGVPIEFKPHIFEKFAQADATNTKQKGGTGLGLSIVKQIVERLGGTIGFDDAASGGAVFYVDLPAWDGSAGGQIDIDSDLGNARVLFCEDDRALAAIMREQLRRAGFAVDLAHTVAAAITRTDATRYAAVLVDLQLPDGDGVSLIVRLRAQAHYREVPIIVIAGDSAQGRSDVRSSRLNVMRWLNKPIAFDPLIKVLKAATARPPGQRPRVLHVDDDRDVLALVNHELCPIVDVISADSLEAARCTLATGGIDLVVLDIALGEESGLDLLPELRSTVGRAIPVIIFSRYGADVPCDDQIYPALCKMSSSLESLGEAVRGRLALSAAYAATEVT